MKRPYGSASPYLCKDDKEKLTKHKLIKLSKSILFLIPTIILIWLFIPQQNLRPFYTNIPLNGRALITNKLQEGKLYKLIVTGEYNNINGDKFKNPGNPERSLPTIYINNTPTKPDIIDNDKHKQVFYISGKDRPVEVRFVDEGWGDLLGFTYIDNEGSITTSIEEADFKVWTDTKPYLQSERIVIHYTLDPMPGPSDKIFMRLIDGEGKEVYYIDTDDILEFREGYPSQLPTDDENEFMWFGTFYNDNDILQFLKSGCYKMEFGMLRRGEEFLASPPPGEKLPVHIAITHRMSGEFPEVVQRKEYKGYDGFPYCTHRCLKQVQSYPMGIEELYTPDEGVGEDFLYFGERGPWLGYGEVAPECIGLIQRTLNLIRSAHREIYERRQGETDLLDITSIYDHQTRHLVKWFKNTYEVEPESEKEILKKYINLPPSSESEVTYEDLSYIISGDTLKEMLDVQFKPAQFPTPIYLEDLENLPSYNPDDRLHSLLHIYEDVGSWANEKSKFTKQPSNKEDLMEGVIYNITDDEFVAILMAFSYQESGMVQRTGSGRIFRAGSGWGSATGYMQLTADVIYTNSYVIRFFDGGKTSSKTLGSLPRHLKYFVRNVNRWNIEIGAQFLKDMWENCGKSSFDKRFREEMKRGGVLDPTELDGLLMRVKLAGASYNAGPEALRVMIHYPYDIPGTRENESVNIFFDEYEADFEEYVKKFRDDLVLHSRGQYTFPMERTAEGRRIYNKLIHWLGPYWKKRKENIGWDEAAIMKLEREVIRYVHNTSVNVPRLLDKKERERIFRDKDFGVLIVKKEEEDIEYSHEEEVEKADVEKPSDVLPEPEK